MTNYRSLNHSKWACQYHVVFIPKYRKKAIYGSLRRHLGGVLRELARQRESEVEEGHLLADHVHMLVSIPPKYSVAQVIGYMKGKSAIHIAREFAGRSRSFVGQHFWARGYFVSTLGRDERAIRAYIRAQEQEDRRQEQLRLDETATRRVAQVAAQWPRPAALSGSQLKPPALPGDTYCVDVLVGSEAREKQPSVVSTKKPESSRACSAATAVCRSSSTRSAASPGVRSKFGVSRYCARSSWTAFSIYLDAGMLGLKRVR